MSDTSGMNAETEMCLVGAAGALTVGTWDSTRSERQILFLQGAANGDECELNQVIKKILPKVFHQLMCGTSVCFMCIHAIESTPEYLHQKTHLCSVQHSPFHATYKINLALTQFFEVPPSYSLIISLLMENQIYDLLL